MVVVAAAAAVVVVDDEDGIQGWWRWMMKMAFNGGGSVFGQRRWGLRIRDDEGTMETDISSGAWQRRALVFDGGN